MKEKRGIEGRNKRANCVSSSFSFFLLVSRFMLHLPFQSADRII
jgi:hypothetical protein